MFFSCYCWPLVFNLLAILLSHVVFDMHIDFSYIFIDCWSFVLTTRHPTNSWNWDVKQYYQNKILISILYDRQSAACFGKIKGNTQIQIHVLQNQLANYTSINQLHIAHPDIHWLNAWLQTEFTGDALAEPVNRYLQSCNRQLMPWNFQIQYRYLHFNVIMCRIDVYCTLLTRWRKR